MTPFSSRARDRALHAVLVAVTRLTIPALGGNQGAGAIGGSISQVNAVRDAIVDRVASASPNEADRTRAELESVIEMWRARARRSARPRLLRLGAADEVVVGRNIKGDGHERGVRDPLLAA